MKLIRELIIVLLLFGAIALLITPLVSTPRGHARRATCMSDMSQIALALLCYENHKGYFPPPYTVDENGKPLHSWRTLLLPIIEYNQLYDEIRFDEPWDSEHNKQFHDIEIPLFRCRSTDPDRPRTATSYDVVIGPNTIFPPFDGETQPKVSIDDISQAAGTSFTILLVERKTPVHWMQPSGIALDDLPNEIDWRHNGAANFVFADRNIHVFSQKLPLDILKRLCNWKDYEKSDCERILQAIQKDEQDRSVDWERKRRSEFFIVQSIGIGSAVFVCLMIFLMMMRKPRSSGDCGGVPPTSPAP